VRRIALAAVLLLAPLVARGAPPHVEIKGASVATLGTPIYLDVAGTVTEKPLKVRTQGPGAISVRTWYDETAKPGLIELAAGQPGEYWVFVVATGTVDGATDLDFAPWKITVSPVGPAPKPPDPTPPPGPEPPGPNPPQPPGPAPIPLPGLRVLVIYESADLSKLPPAQTAVLYSKSLRDLLNAKCAVGPDGKTKEWRIYDADVDTSGDVETWKAAMARPRRSLPWVVISNGAAGYEGPLPATVDEMAKLVEKYAGGT
jgi:hypothetical protein